MPKGKIMDPASRKSTSVQRKFKLGGRKNTIGALSLNNDELLKRYESTSRGRDRNKIQQVLQARGVLVQGKTSFELVGDAGPQAGDPA